MIIQTKNKKFYPHAKTTILIVFIVLIISIICFGGGYALGYASGWVQCVDLGLNFVKIDNVVDKELIRTAILTYKSSLGGWGFNPESPFYINGN